MYGQHTLGLHNSVVAALWLNSLQITEQDSKHTASAKASDYTTELWGVVRAWDVLCGVPGHGQCVGVQCMGWPISCCLQQCLV